MTSTKVALYVSANHAENDLFYQLRWVDGADQPPAFPATRCNLHVGDVMVTRTEPCADAAVAARIATAFGGGGEAGAVQQPLLVIERKEVNDLVNSMREVSADGVARRQRWGDERARINAYCAVTHARPILLVEGYFKHAANASDIGKMTEAEFRRALLRVALKDGWHVEYTTNHYDSARLLVEIARFCEREGVTPERWRRLDELAAGVDVDSVALSVRKSANQTPRAWFRNSLCAVPGFSADKAVVVVDAYVHMGALCDAAARDAKALAREVARLPLPNAARTSTGKMRTIGPACAGRLVDFVLGSATPSQGKKRKAAAAQPQAAGEDEDDAEDDE